MEQLLYVLRYFPSLVIFLILFGVIVGLVLAAFLPVYGQPTIIQFISHQPAQEPADYKGCLVRSIFYLVICITIIGLTVFYIPTLASSPSSTDQVKALIQDYYNNLNKKDYRAAYNLFKHCRQSYNQFVNDFADTENSIVSFDSIEQLSNGNVEAIVTVYAEEKNLPPGQYNTYGLVYTAGEDQDIYKLFNGYTLPSFAQFC
jgi:ABC-type multidrug transport system fused ATPase/permease subunit